MYEPLVKEEEKKRGRAKWAKYSLVPYNEEIRRLATFSEKHAEIDRREEAFYISSPNLDLFPSELNKTIEDINRALSELTKSNTRSLYVLLAIWLGKQNSDKPKMEDIKRIVRIPLSEVYTRWGLELTNNSRRNRTISQERSRLKKSLLKSLNIICTTPFSLTGKSKAGKIEGVITFGSSGYFEGSSLVFHFDDRMAYSLLHSFYIHLPPEFFKMDGKYNRAQVLLLHLCFLASQDKNVLNNRHDIVGVSNIIEQCGYPDPRDPQIIKSRKQKEYIFQAMQRDLEYLEQEGYIKWHWCLAGKENLPDNLLPVEKVPFSVWLETFYVKFDLVGAPKLEAQVKDIKRRMRKDGKQKRVRRKPVKKKATSSTQQQEQLPLT